MTQFTDLTDEEQQVLVALVAQHGSQRILPKLLERTIDAERVAKLALEERNRYLADAKANDEEYIRACKQRDELGAQLKRRTEWHQETSARLAYMRRQHAYLRDEADRMREDEVVSAELGRNVTDLPF